MATRRSRRSRFTLRFACIALAGLPLALTSNPGMAQKFGGASLHAGTLEVPVNKSQIVSTDRTIVKAMIGNDEIADVLPITERSVYVLGKKMGTTSLTLYDGGGRVISVMDIAVGPDVEALGAQLQELIPGEKIEARISNDSVVLTGLVNSAGAASRAAQLAHAFAGVKVINLISMGSSQQVMLEVRFAEVSRQLGEKVGVSSFGASRGGSFDAAVGSAAQLLPDPVTGIGVMKLGAIAESFGIFRKKFSIGDTDIESTLDALERRGLSKTLAQPTLVALSGERASFLAGGEFPIPVIQAGGASGNDTPPITVEFKPFGVSLAFTPTVLGDKTISMVVEPEVSAIDPTVSFTVGNITIPGLRTRRVSTTLELRDGESFAIAGLLQRDFETTVRQVPLLGNIPILGALFRSSSFQKGETELLIVVTPHLVQPLRPDQVRLPTDRVADPQALGTVLFGQSYRQNKIEPAKPPVPVVPTSPQSAAPQNPAVSGDPAKEVGYAY